MARTTFTAVVTTYTYDADNQLKNDSNTTFSYDATGNRSSTVTGGATFTYSTTTGNQLQYDGQWTYTYDAEGNETGKVQAGGDHWTYTYDNKNELVEADHYATLTSTSDKSVVYTYDALGNRIAQSYDADGAGGGTAVVTKFVLDDWKASNGHLMGNTNWDVIETLDGSSSLKSRNIFGDAVDQVFAEMAYSGGTFTPAYTLTDVRGSVRDVVNNSGTVLDSINYGAFGTILAGETNSANRGMYAWTGRQLDVETGLQYNRARYYDSATGRWISQDPLGFDAGDSNLYRYAMNRPTVESDPSGLQAADPLAAVKKIQGDSKKILDDLQKADPSDPRLLFLNVQQDILNQLATSPYFAKNPQAADWLARTLNVFMNSLNNAIKGNFAHDDNRDTKKFAQGMLDFMEGKKAGAWWKVTFDDCEKNARAAIKNNIKSPTSGEIYAMKMAMTHIMYDLLLSIQSEGVGTDADWNEIGKAVASAMKKNNLMQPDLVDWMAQMLGAPFDIGRVRDNMRKDVIENLKKVWGLDPVANPYKGAKDGIIKKYKGSL